MGKLSVFNQVTLDGYFADENGDIGWAHREESQDNEWNDFVEGNAKGEGILLFGRKTYDMMKSYWPTPAGERDDPVVAKRMNELPKVVFSRTMDHADWNNTRVVKGDIAEEVRKLKASGQDLTILGSGSIVSQLAKEDVIDEIHLVVNPVVLGKGRTMFEGVDHRLMFRPTHTRTFRNGNVVLDYQRA